MGWGEGGGQVLSPTSPPRGKINGETFMYLAMSIRNFKNIVPLLVIPLLVIYLKKVINKML